MGNPAQTSARRILWLSFAAAGLLGPAVWGLLQLLSPQDEPTDFMNVRLGMTAAQVRAHIVRPGRFSTETDPSGLLVLTWTPADPTDSVREARFEIHDGMVVAIRAQLRGSRPAALTVAPEAVRRTAPRPGGGSEFVLLARGCPLHEEEVEDLLRAP